MRTDPISDGSDHGTPADGAGVDPTASPTPGSVEPGSVGRGEPGASPQRTEQTLLEQLGGVSGLIYSTVPILVFVPVNSLVDLRAAIIAALVTAGLIFVVRLIRREPLQPAVSGLIGVAICAFIAHRTGSAKGYFLFGIWTMVVYAAVLAASILVRWPLIGVVWNMVNGNGSGWRRHRRTLLAYDLATGCWALLFLARYLVQSSLYVNDQTGWLAASRIAMGWPLTAVAVLATVVLVRWAERGEAKPPTHRRASEPAARNDD